MNSTIEVISERRSIRAFEPKPIPRETIQKIIDAGNQAPFTSITRSQPWRFVVVGDPKFKKKLVQATLPSWKKSMDAMKETHPDIFNMGMDLYNALDEPKDVIYYDAPAIVFVIGPSNSTVSCALACENMLIAAKSLGLGSCYVGFGSLIKGDKEIVKALELKEDEAIFGPILLGYPKVGPSEALVKALEGIGPIKKEPSIKWIT